MKKKLRGARRCARKTAKFYWAFGRLPYGLTEALSFLDLESILIFNETLGRHSKPAVKALFKKSAEEDADNPPSHLPHPASELLCCGAGVQDLHYRRMFQ